VNHTRGQKLGTNSSDPPPPKSSSPHLSSLHVLTRAQRTRVYFIPQHWLLCHARHRARQLKKKILNTFQLSLVVSYSNANASSPGFTVTGSIFIGLTPLESQQRLTQLTQHATHESKTKYTLLYAKGHSAQPDMFWRTHHTKSDPKSMRVMPLCLWGV
jgi:hypothetical protein